MPDERIDRIARDLTNLALKTAVELAELQTRVARTDEDRDEAQALRRELEKLARAFGEYQARTEAAVSASVTATEVADRAAEAVGTKRLTKWQIRGIVATAVIGATGLILTAIQALHALAG